MTGPEASLASRCPLLWTGCRLLPFPAPLGPEGEAQGPVTQLPPGTRDRHPVGSKDAKGAKGHTFWLETLGCAKNQVDSDKLAGVLENDGYRPARRPDKADLVVVNTCAFIEAAREESIGAVLQLAGAKKQGATLTVTGCMAERYGQELADALPEVDLVAGFGVPVQFAGDRLGAN